jgi:hypothetical protein
MLTFGVEPLPPTFHVIVWVELPGHETAEFGEVTENAAPDTVTVIVLVA